MLHDLYGDQALEGAKAALRLAGEICDDQAIDLWSEVCAILAAG